MLLAAFAAWSVAAADASAQNRINVSDVQIMLIFTGYLAQPGIQGRPDNETQAALRNFAQNGTGILDRAVLSRLEAAARSSRERYRFELESDSAADVEIGIPRALVSTPRKATWGTNWRAPDQSIEIDTLAIPTSRHTIESLHSTLTSRPRRQVTTSRINADEFFIEGEDVRESNLFRVYATRSRNMIRGYSLVFKRSRRNELHAVMNAISSSFVADPKGARSTFDIRSAPAVSGVAPSPPPSPQPSPSVAQPPPAATRAPPIVTANYQTLASLLERIVDDNEDVVDFHVASREIDSATGRVTVEVTKTIFANGASDAGPSASLVGDAFNLLPVVDARDPKRAHLAFSNPEQNRTFVLVTVSRRDEAAVRRWAQGVQANLDKLAELTGRTSDPLASLKLFRQGRQFN